MNAYKKRRINLQTCKRCGTAFSPKLDVCPNCHFDRTQRTSTPTITEGTGRGYHGAACDICPHCHGTADWCPLLD